MKTFYWSRKPGNFVNKNTGESILESLKELKIEGPKFTGSVREWYETLVETIYDCGSGMKKPKVYTSSIILTILECTCLFKSNLNKKLSFIGKISQFEIYIDARMPNNEIKIVEGTDVRKVIVQDLNII